MTWYSHNNLSDWRHEIINSFSFVTICSTSWITQCCPRYIFILPFTRAWHYIMILRWCKLSSEFNSTFFRYNNKSIWSILIKTSIWRVVCPILLGTLRSFVFSRINEISLISLWLFSIMVSLEMWVADFLLQNQTTTSHTL